MASWIEHLNVADKMIDNLSVDPVYFAAGNIAPDCGEKLAYRVFSPDTMTTHFTKADKDECEYSEFYNEYVRNEKDIKRLSFFSGYYTHLYTDVLWTIKVVREQKEKYALLMQEKGEDEFYRKLKGDWYGLDFQYLKAHPDMRMWRYFCSIEEFPNTYLNFYKEDAFTTKFQQIRGFYSTVSQTRPRKFHYMQPYEWESFAEEAAVIITSELKSEGFSLIK